jgi:hypothetical protein
VVTFTPPGALPAGKSPPYPLDKRLGEPQSRPGCYGEEKNFALPGIETTVSSPQPVPVPTELSRLLRFFLLDKNLFEFSEPHLSLINWDSRCCSVLSYYVLRSSAVTLYPVLHLSYLGD